MPIELASVSRSYGANEVLHDVNLTLEAGSVTAVQGPSGSGKTTLLAILGGLIRPTMGDVRGIPTEAGAVQWIHQTINLLSRRSAQDNVMISLYCLGLSRRAAKPRAADALRDVGLYAERLRRANTLSGGEAQRVSIARALASAPALVLADEPTGQLDRATSNVVIEALLALPKTDTTVVVATHDLDVAERCDRILTLESGTLVGSS